MKSFPLLPKNYSTITYKHLFGLSFQFWCLSPPQKHAVLLQCNCSCGSIWKKHTTLFQGHHTFCIPHIEVKGTISRLHGPFVSLLWVFCWTILLHLGTQLPAGRFAPARPPNSDLGGRDALPWHPWRYPTPQPTKKIKMCYVILLLKFPMKKWQLHNVSLYSSQSLTANWSLEIGCKRMMIFGGTLFGLEHQVYRTKESSNKNIIFIGKRILAYGLWLQIRVSKTEHWLVRIIDVVFTVGVIHFFWRGARPRSIPGQSS